MDDGLNNGLVETMRDGDDHVELSGDVNRQRTTATNGIEQVEGLLGFQFQILGQQVGARHW